MTGTEPVSGSERTVVLVIACARPRYLRRALASLRDHPPPSGVEVVVSEDGADPEVGEEVRASGIVDAHLHHDPEPPVDEDGPNYGYMRVSSHYRWALDRAFQDHGATQVVVLEDDLEVACDFFSYLLAFAPLLRSDPSVLAVSAFSDNGRPGLASDPTVVHRTDIIPGLGWLLTDSLWEELRAVWPVAHWDWWLRAPEIRRGRSTLRPEVSRTLSFGRFGVSGGEGHEEFLSQMILNDEPVNWSAVDIDAYRLAPYDRSLRDAIAVSEVVSTDRLGRGDLAGPARIEYGSLDEMWQVADALHLVNVQENGEWKTSYRGVIPLRVDGREVYVVPRDWRDRFSGATPPATAT